MSIVFAGLSPHPPLLIPEVGRTDRDQVSLTDQAMTKLAGLLYQSKPDLLVIISPHGPVFSDAISIFNKPTLEGNFGQFRAPQISFHEEVDQQAAMELKNAAEELGIMVAMMGDRECRQYRIEPKLDHGVMVPLYYMREMGVKVPLLPITMGMLPDEDLYHFGSLIAEVSEKMDKRIAIIASGDLSHRLTPQAPAGFNPHGKEFDDFLIKTLKKYDVETLFSIDQKLIEKAGECGFRPILMMLGALDGLEVESEVISYEGPFGVGYGVAAFKPTGERRDSLINKLYDQRSVRLKGVQEKEHPLVRLARRTIENKVNGQSTSPPGELTPEMEERAGVFVSIKKHGQLRGCIGTTEPTRSNIAQEIIQNAVSAAFNDPRFFPIDQDELDDLTISVDVLGQPEPIHSTKELDPVRYGVIVEQNGKRGLLLPDLEGVDTVQEQVKIAKQKAGIYNDDDLALYRFEVKRYR